MSVLAFERAIVGSRMWTQVREEYPVRLVSIVPAEPLSTPDRAEIARCSTPLIGNAGAMRTGLLNPVTLSGNDLASSGLR
jgi:hypothetical protein